jgi:hypothetical protein
MVVAVLVSVRAQIGGAMTEPLFTENELAELEKIVHYATEVAPNVVGHVVWNIDDMDPVFDLLPRLVATARLANDQAEDIEELRSGLEACQKRELEALENVDKLEDLANEQADHLLEGERLMKDVQAFNKQLVERVEFFDSVLARLVAKGDAMQRALEAADAQDGKPKC